MEKLTALCISALLLSSLSGPVQASETGAGHIGEIIVTNGGTVLFNHSGVRTTAPSCQLASIPTRWAFNSATPAGQSMLASLLSAKGMGKAVRISGTATCPDWSDTESVKYFIIE